MLFRSEYHDPAGGQRRSAREFIPTTVRSKPLRLLMPSLCSQRDRRAASEEDGPAADHSNTLSPSTPRLRNDSNNSPQCRWVVYRVLMYIGRYDGHVFTGCSAAVTFNRYRSVRRLTAND